jgi:hypothetical protein
MHKSILAGLAGGLAAIILWAGLTWLSGFYLGFIAAFFGLAVGIAFRAADKEKASTARGVAAAAITVLAILVGKFAVASIAAQQRVDEVMDDYDMSGELSGDDIIVMSIADRILWEREDDGIESEWIETDSEDPRDFYPADVWAEAQDEFAALSEEDKQAFRDDYAVTAEGNAELAATGLAVVFFIFSFRLLDLLWIGTSIGVAYKFGTATEDGEAAVQSEALPAHFTSGSPLRGMPSAPIAPAAPAPAQRNAA